MYFPGTKFSRNTRYVNEQKKIKKEKKKKSNLQKSDEIFFSQLAFRIILSVSIHVYIYTFIFSPHVYSGEKV